MPATLDHGYEIPHIMPWDKPSTGLSDDVTAPNPTVPKAFEDEARPSAAVRQCRTATQSPYRVIPIGASTCCLLWT